MTLPGLASLLSMLAAASLGVPGGPKWEATVLFEPAISEKIVSATLLQCANERCREAVPLRRYGPQGIDCCQLACRTLAYRYEPYSMLVVETSLRKLSSAPFKSPGWTPEFSPAPYQLKEEKDHALYRARIVGERIELTAVPFYEDVGSQELVEYARLKGLFPVPRPSKKPRPVSKAVMDRGVMWSAVYSCVYSNDWPLKKRALVSTTEPLRPSQSLETGLLARGFVAHPPRTVETPGGTSLVRAYRKTEGGDFAFAVIQAPGPEADPWFVNLQFGEKGNEQLGVEAAEFFLEALFPDAVERETARRHILRQWGTIQVGRIRVEAREEATQSRRRTISFTSQAAGSQ